MLSLKTEMQTGVPEEGDQKHCLVYLTYAVERSNRYFQRKKIRYNQRNAITVILPKKDLAVML